MTVLVVADSTCLIALDRIETIDILPAVFGDVLIPPAVNREFNVAYPWLKVSSPTNHKLVSSLKLMVDDGEAEAIALASELAALVILDDRQARRVARSMGLHILGTLGCLLKAKGAKVVPAVGPIIDHLEAKGFYLTTALKTEALRLAGE